MSNCEFSREKLIEEGSVNYSVVDELRTHVEAANSRTSPERTRKAISKQLDFAFEYAGEDSFVIGILQKLFEASQYDWTETPGGFQDNEENAVFNLTVGKVDAAVRSALRHGIGHQDRPECRDLRRTLDKVTEAVKD